MDCLWLQAQGKCSESMPQYSDWIRNTAPTHVSIDYDAQDVVDMFRGRGKLIKEG